MKYMGSKSRIAKEIVPIIQKYIDDMGIQNYYEPFVGGANIIDKIECENRYGSDLNKYLIALLKRVQENKELLPLVTRELYNEVRSNYKNGVYEDWYVGNIGFLASYNGKWFDGGYANTGWETTKYGKRYRDYYSEAKNNILNQSKHLNEIKFEVNDYINVNIINGSLIYCDPPYKGTTKYDNAKQFNYDKFYDWLREKAKNNIVLLSEQNAPTDFTCIWEKQTSRSISVTDKRKVTEKLFLVN